MIISGFKGIRGDKNQIFCTLVVSSTFPNIALMHISVVDMCHEDLLCHFESAYKFIKEGVTRGAILVHCYHGVSLFQFFKILTYIYCILEIKT